MSYILDALRKADAQRAANPARGIHAQPLHASATDSHGRGAYSPWLWVVAAAALVAVGTGGWYLYRGKTDNVPARQDRVELAARAPAAAATLAQRQAAPVVGNTVAAPPLAAPAATPVPAPAVASVAAAVIQPPPPAPNPGFTTPAGNSRVGSLPMMRGPQPGSPVSRMEPAPQAQAQGTGAPLPGASGTPGAPPGQFEVPPAVRTPQAPAPTPPMTQVPAPPAPVAAPAQRPMAVPSTGAVSAPVAALPPTPPVAGLPPDAPKLVLSGGVFSNNPAQRMLIVNGQVFNEGSEVGPGVVLEEVKAKTVVLRFRGARYTVGY